MGLLEVCLPVSVSQWEFGTGLCGYMLSGPLVLRTPCHQEFLPLSNLSFTQLSSQNPTQVGWLLIAFCVLVI